MRVLVTGAAGFVGGHSINELKKAGHDIVAMIAPDQPPHSLPPESSAICDLLDAQGLGKIVSRFKPDACLHLAGIAFVPAGWSNPQEVFRVNVIGTVNLLEAFRMHQPGARFLAITSSQIYGQQPRDHLITEDDAPAPDNLYALSKWSADGTALLYARRYGMHIMTARPCNHIGPGQSEHFVVAAFARQLIEIARGNQPNTMKVGNLKSEREFTDVRDTARAYRLLLEKGRAGTAYNVASGRLITIQALFDKLCDAAGVTPKVEIDPERYRPTDTQPLLDISRILNDTGWKPEIPIETTLRDVVQDIAAR